MRDQQSQTKILNSNSGKKDVKTLFVDALKKHQEKDFKGALKGYDKVLKITPDLPEALNFQAMAHHELGRNVKARGILEKLLKQKPDFLEAKNNLGNVQMEMGNLDEALEIFTEILQSGHETAEIYYNLGSVLFQKQSHPKAAIALTRAAEIDPKHGDAFLLLGDSLRELNDSQGAIEAYEKAIELKPEDYSPLAKLGRISIVAGDFDMAKEAFTRALAINPDVPEARQGLLKIGDSSTPEKIEEIKDQLDDATDDLRKMNLSFILGDAYAKNKDYDSSFKHYCEANALAQQDINYTLEGNLAFLDAVAEVFNPEFLEENFGKGHDSLAPIFILGMPRSGTTLTEQILASHPMVDARGEMKILGKFASGLNIEIDRPVSFPFSLKLLGDEIFQKLGKNYLDVANLNKQGKYRLTDKMPSNFQYVGLIHLILPNARIIHCKRNPIDTCISNFTKNFRNGQYFSYDLEWLGKYYRGYDKLMTHWETVLPGKMLSVQYEETVGDIEAQARRILAHCGLPWEPSVLDFHKTERPVWTASAEQVRKPIYDSSVERWRRYERHISPLLEALGPLAKT